MAFEARINSGALFKNDKKTAAKHPDYQGNENVVCSKCGEASSYRLAAWLKEGKKGKFLSLAVSEDTKGKGQPKPDTEGIPF